MVAEKWLGTGFVFTGDDKMLSERESFYKANLVPPGEQISVNNIINAILGN